MPYFIRNKNKVYSGMAGAHGVKWAVINENTKQLNIVVFTNMRDAQEVLDTLFDTDAKISNDLDYVNN